MKALVLCGGKGSRFESVHFYGSKQLFPLANKPLLWYILEQVAASGIKDTIIITSSKTEDSVKEYVQDGMKWRLNVTFVNQEPLGLAHAVREARPYLKDEPFIMQLGDNFSSASFGSMIEEFEKNSLDALVGLHKVFDPARFGIAQLNKDRTVNRVVEKPKTTDFGDLGMIGTYLFSNSIHEAIDNIVPSLRGELEITQAIQRLIDEKKTVGSFILNSFWIHLDTLDDVIRCNRTMLDRYCAQNVQGKIINSSLKKNLVIPKTSIVNNSVLIGPCIVGEDCIIERSHLGPYSCIGNGTNIIDSKIESSIILDSITIENRELFKTVVTGK
jgi:glucose-1-phosphate thymidylyltransferase